MKTKERIKALEREIKEIKESLRIKTKLPDDYTGWVVDSAFPKWMVYCVDGVIKYGFSVHGSWFKKSALVTFSDSDRPATKEEVEQRLKAEAERRGYKEGVKVKCLSPGNTDGTIKEFWYFRSEYNQLWFKGHGYNALIFKDGKWAEIIEEPKINNIAVENLTRETGKEIIRLFQKLGVDTEDCKGSNCKYNREKFIYYGVFNGKFNTHTLEYCQENNIKIITLDQLRELAGEKEKTFPRTMMVREGDHKEWFRIEVVLIYNDLAWVLPGRPDVMHGYKQFKEID